MSCRLALIAGVVVLCGAMTAFALPWFRPLARWRARNECTAARPWDQWRVASKHFFDHHGAVTVESGVLRLAAGEPGTGVRFTGDVPRSDYEIAFEARRIEGRDFFCGLTFPVGESQCSLILGGWGGGSTGLSNVNDVHADENETNGFLDVQDGRWYAIRLRVTAERIAVWIDSRQTIDLPRAGRRFSIWWEQQPLAPLGIAAWRTTAEFRDFRVTRLSSASAR